MSAVGQPSLEPRFSGSTAAPELAPSPSAVSGGTPPTKTAPARLALTQRAPQMMRIHLVRTAVRVSVLLAGDMVALLLLRVVVRGVRDVGWFGSATSELVNKIIPPGGLPLVQLVPAVLLGLIAVDTYGASDRRRDAGRLVAGATLGLALPFWSHLWSHFSLLLLPGFILLAGLIGLTLISERYLIDQAVLKLWPIGPGAARALLISRGEHTLRALEHPTLSDARSYAVGGILDPEELGLQGQEGFTRLCQTLKRYRADTVVLSGPLDDRALALV
ncbi:MAG: hypothetical protein ACJ8AX_05675, partial [Gemmatimonadales bacterium]